MLGSKSDAVNIRTQVYNVIKKNICGGRYEPGQRLNEAELAGLLKVSRSPVREALRQLAADGLVVEQPNRGVFVREFSPRDIQDLFDLRMLLESYSIRRSARFMTAGQGQELHHCLDQLAIFHQQHDMQKHAEADAQLHWLIVRLGGNPMAEDIYRRIAAQIQQFRVYALESKQRFQESLTEHTAIVECLLAGNVEEAARVDHLHLELARDKISEHLVSGHCRPAE